MQPKCSKMNFTCSKITIHHAIFLLTVRLVGSHFGWILYRFCSVHLLLTAFYFHKMVSVCVCDTFVRRIYLRPHFFIFNYTGVGSGLVGLAVLSNFSLLSICQFGMFQSAELESQMTSVERIIEYCDLPSEPSLESDEKNEPPESWPRQGEIQFKSLSLRYAEYGQHVLRNLTFRIEAKVKAIFQFRIDD